VELRDTNGGIVPSSGGFAEISCWAAPEREAQTVTPGFTIGSVALGLDLRVRLPGAVPQVQRVAGPSRPGERVVVTFTADPDIPWLQGRVVDTVGKPLVRKGFSSFVRFADVRRLSVVTTDQDGRFALPLPGMLGKRVELVHLVMNKAGEEWWMAR